MALVATACNRDSATTGPSGKVGKDFAANLRLISGDQQVGPLGAALTQPVVVKVVDAGGQAVQGATVTFSVRAGGGSINPAANVSDAAGLVSSTWTMGNTLGAGKVVALLTNNFVLDSTTFTATAVVGAAAVFTKVSGDLQTFNAGRRLPAALVVKVQDPFGNNVSGVKVTWAPSALNGTVSFITDTTAADGSASANWTLGAAATGQTLSASVTGKPALVFTATAIADTGRTFIITSAPPAAGPVSTPLGTVSVRVTDQYGNPVAAAAITWNDSLSAGSTLSTSAGTTSAAGTASTTWTLARRAGPQILRAKLSGRTETVTVSANATIQFSELFAGNFMTCGVVASNNNVYCWGSGTDGQLGQGTFTNSSAPGLLVPQSGDPITGVALQARQMAGGRNGFCSLTIARTLYCWGRQFGAAGVASPAAVTLTAGGATVTPAAVFMGEDFGCLVTLAGDPFCTGNNFNGQLGNGLAPTGTASGTWSSMTTPGGQPLFASIGVGRAHGCAVPRFNAAAIPAGSSQLVYCWGLNNAGQVGDGTTTNRFAPVGVTAPFAAIRFDSASLSVGGSHACALEGLGSTTPGRAWCWGNNGSGQLGINSQVQSPAPIAVLPPTGGATLTFTRISAGEHHTCGVTAGGAFCWGRNDYGQLGIGAASGTPTLVPVAVGGGLVFRSLTVGELFSCGVVGPATIPGSASQSAGTAYCWGDNLFGQLGMNASGSSVPVTTPTRVSFQP